jgi:hypothetical protein
LHSRFFLSLACSPSRQMINAQCEHMPLVRKVEVLTGSVGARSFCVIAMATPIALAPALAMPDHSIPIIIA